jgi:hypothetical protein
MSFREPVPPHRCQDCPRLIRWALACCWDCSALRRAKAVFVPPYFPY